MISPQPKPTNNIVPFDALATPNLFNEDAEKAVLGSILTYPAMFQRLNALLEPGDFFFKKHEYIWEAFRVVAGKGDEIDYLTVSTQLKSVGRIEDIGGLPYLTQTLLGIPDTSNATAYATEVKRISLRRKGMMFADEARALFINQATPLEQSLPQIYGRLQTLMSALPNRSTSSAAAAVELLQAQPKQQFISTGYLDLDKHITGLVRGEMCVSAGDTGMGKSYLALNIAWNIATRGIPVFYASTEMSVPQLTRRLIQINTGITAVQIARGLDKTQAAQLQSFLEYFKTIPLYLDNDDTGIPLTPGKARNRVMRSVGEHGVQVAFFDHAHDMELDPDDERKHGGTANTKRSYIIQSLVELVRTAGLYGWTVAQINREVVKRQDKRPTKHDIRDTGRFEQLAYQIVLIHREHVYDTAADPHDTELIIDKVRDNGYPGSVHLYSDDNIKLKNGQPRRINLEDL